MTRNSSG